MRRPLAIVATVLLAVVAAVTAGCGDDDATSEYCDDLRAVRDDVTELADPDVFSDRSEFDARLEELRDDLDALSDSAEGAARGDLDDLDDTLAELEDQLDSVADDPTTEGARDALDGLGAVVRSGVGVISTLVDSC